MKPFAIALVLMVSTTPAWALRKITADEDKKISDQISAGGKLDFKIQVAKSSLNDKGKSQAELAALAARIKELSHDRAAAYNKAIWLTLEFYEI